MHEISISTPSRTLFAVPFWIAAHEGYFADEGIDATLEIVGDSSAIKDRLRAGVDQFSIDPPDGIILDALSGGPLRIIAGNACRPPLFIVSRPHITALAQLRGATIGVLSLNEGSSKLIPKIAAAAGLSMADVKVIEVGGAPTRKQLLLDGKIDVGLQPMPLNFEAAAAGLNNLGWTGQFEPYWQFTTINTNIEWARREPAVVTGVLRALGRGMTAMTSYAKAAQIVEPELLCGIEHAEKALRECVRLGILDRQLLVSELGLSKVFANMQADETIDSGRHFEMTGFSDFRFLHAAQGATALR